MKKCLLLLPFVFISLSCNEFVPQEEQENKLPDFELDEVATSTSGTSTRGSASSFDNQSIEYFDITFLNYDGTVLETTTVGANVVPVYLGATPTRPGGDDYDYVFVGWSPELYPAWQNETYTALFEIRHKTKYQITWLNYDGTLLQTDTFYEGSVVYYSGENPTKESDERFNYHFAGWDKELGYAYSDATYTAIFNPSIRLYKVTFYSDENTPILEKYYEYNSTPTYGGEEPTKQSTAQYSYKFKGWDKEFTNVVNDQKYYAVYDSTVRKYTVFFYTDETKQKLIYSKDYNYGETPSYEKDELPTKDKDTNYKYIFKKWNSEFKPVVENAEYWGVYDKIERKNFKVRYYLTITFGGHLIDEIIVENGDKIPAQSRIYSFTNEYDTSLFPGQFPGLSYKVGEPDDYYYETVVTKDMVVYVDKVWFLGENGLLMKNYDFNNVWLFKNDGSKVRFRDYYPI